MKRMIAVLLSLLSLATMCVPSLAAELPTIDTSRTGSIEIYKYIQENTAEDAVIAFAKPRALSMNTQRRAEGEA